MLWGIAPDLGHLFQNRLQMSPLIERAATIEVTPLNYRDLLTFPR